MILKGRVGFKQARVGNSLSKCIAVGSTVKLVSTQFGLAVTQGYLEESRDIRLEK